MPRVPDSVTPMSQLDQFSRTSAEMFDPAIAQGKSVRLQNQFAQRAEDTLAAHIGRTGPAAEAQKKAPAAIASAIQRAIHLNGALSGNPFGNQPGQNARFAATGAVDPTPKLVM